MNKMNCNDELERGLTGLANSGNTCYMNAAIQCLRMIPGLTEYFLRSRSTRSQSDVVKAYANLVFEMWNENQTILPKTFTNAVSAAGFQQIHRQHDSQEFVIRLMDMLHQGLKMKSNVTVSNGNNSSETAWSKFLKHNGDSVLIQLFWAQLMSVVRCETCGTESSTFDPYSYLSLPMLASGTTTIDLADCFNQFGVEDKLTGANSYDCDKCDEKTTAVRTMGIWSLPRYLLVHLKRFNNRCKDNRPVTYPLDDFKIGRWASNPKDRDATYRLIAICCHVGGMQSGHYFAYCRHDNRSADRHDDNRRNACRSADNRRSTGGHDNGRRNVGNRHDDRSNNSHWYKYDDTRVTKVNESELLNLTRQPYYFVYQRIN